MAGLISVQARLFARVRIERRRAGSYVVITVMTAALAAAGGTTAFGASAVDGRIAAAAVQQLRATYAGPSAMVAALTDGSARTRSLASADLDADGAPELIVGYSWQGAGIVTVHRGNIDAIAPTRDYVFEQMQRGIVPELLLPDARALAVPEPVSDTLAGDFTNDGQADVLVMTVHGRLYVYAGDGRGGLSAARHIPLDGLVTTVAAGEFRAADGRRDLAIGLSGSAGPQLAVFDGVSGGVDSAPMRFPLQAAATSIRLGELDGDPYQDIAVAAGGQLAIVHGWGRKSSPALSSRIERVPQASGVRAIEIGYFIPDRDGRNEIAAAFADGTVRLVRPNDLDTRPLTEADIESRSRGRALFSGNARATVDVESLAAWHSASASGWTVGAPIAHGVNSAPDASPQRLLATTKVSYSGTEDLVVIDARQGVRVVGGGGLEGRSPQASTKLAAALTDLGRAAEGAIAILEMRQKANGDRGIVVLGADGGAPMLVRIAGVAISVDTTNDPSGAGLTAASVCGAGAADCSLRGAIQFANANPGTAINLPAGTYLLTIQGANGCVGGTETLATGNTLGDLEINKDTTISGAGAATTIVRQTGTNDRVMCLNAPLAVDIDYTFSGFTITGGRDGSGIGGGGIIGGEFNNNVTLNSMVVSNNQTTGNSVPGGGGGLVITGGDLTITNSTIGGTSAPGADRTIIAQGNQASTTSGGGIAFTPSSPAHEDGTGILTITGSTISNNKSFGIGGGGADLYTFAFADPGGIGTGHADISTSTFSNNQALGSPGSGTGGGIVAESLDATIATTSFTSNHAGNRGGGIYVGGGTNGVTLNGTTAGVTFSGNTATNAGSTISTAFKVTVQGTNVTLGGDVEVTFGGTWTNTAGSVIAPTNFALVNSGAFVGNNSTTNISGNLSIASNSSAAFNAGTGLWNFNGSGAQAINGPGSPTFYNLHVNKSGGSTLTLNTSIGVNADLSVTTGIMDLTSFTANRTAPGGAITVANVQTLKIGGSGTFPSNYSTHALGTTSTVEYNGTGAQTIAATNYGHLTSSSSGARTLASTGTIGVAGVFTPGAGNTYTNTGSTVNFNGAVPQTIPAFNYNNLTSSSSGTRTLAPAGTVGIADTFMPGSNLYTITGSTVNFNGAGAQTIPAFNYNNLTSSAAGARTLASSNTVGVAGVFTPGGNTYTIAGSTINFNGAGAQTIPAFNYNNLTSSSSGARILSGTIGVASVFTPGGNTYTITGSTVNFNGAGAQTIPAFNYNNLTSSGAGARILSGTIGVAGVFTPGGNTYTVTGSTVNFNGAGPQTIPAFNYNNLTSSASGARTLAPASTVGLAGTFTPGTNAYTVTGSTVNFNGAGPQTIPAFNYNNLTSSSSGARTLAGTVGVAGVFTPGANVYTVTGSTVSFNGSAAQNIPAFPYNNLTDANTIAFVSLVANTTVSGALTVNANAVLNTSTFVLTVNGTYTNNGQIRHTATQTLASTPGPFTFVDGLGVETVRVSGLSAAFGSTTVNTSAGATNPYNSCSSLPANPVRRFWQVTVATGGNALARFAFRNDEVAGGLGTDQLAIYRCLPAGGNWIQIGTTYTRPAPAGPAGGYSSVEATAVPFLATGATYILAQGKPELTVTKTNNVAGAIVAGNSWTWTLSVANSGTANAVFTAGQTILSDNLPNASLNYGTVNVANIGAGVTGGANIVCSIVSSNLTCVASGGTVTLGTANASFNVVFTATPTSALTFANPRAGGACTVDPTNHNAEISEANNTCSNSVVVSKANTTTTITSDNPDASVVGQTVTVVYSVAVTPPGAGTPTGNVTVTDGTQSCVATVAAGQCTISFTSVGSKSLTATYAGDTNYNASPASSPATAHTVNKAATTTTITSDNPDPSVMGNQVTVVYSVVATAPGAGTPTGNVTVSDGTLSCIGTVAAGQCTITFNTAGSRSLTATYAGDTNFNTSTSAAASHQVNGLAPPLPPCTTAPFTDVATNHPFCPEIGWMKDNAISTGFDDGTYRPANNVTRQAMSAFLARVAGATPAACTTEPFTDVPINHPFCPEIQWMKDNNISTGFDDGTYRPASNVTRQAMSAFLARVAGATPAACVSAPFTDVSIGHPFCKEIQWMRDNGISTGFGDGTYRPSTNVTRQAMSAFLYRVSFVP